MRHGPPVPGRYTRDTRDARDTRDTRDTRDRWACGTDFQYQDADHWYRNLDKLIHYVNLNGTVNAFYSTPSIYTDWKKKWKGSYEVAPM